MKEESNRDFTEATHQISFRFNLILLQVGYNKVGTKYKAKTAFCACTKVAFHVHVLV